MSNQLPHYQRRLPIRLAGVCVSIPYMEPENSAAVVKDFLRGQNLEQIGKIEEAIALYEGAVGARFDSSGPYDRLIQLYADRARHDDVVRVAEAALAGVRTYEDKKAWYEQMRAAAIKARSNVPQARPKKSGE